MQNDVGHGGGRRLVRARHWSARHPRLGVSLAAATLILGASTVTPWAASAASPTLTTQASASGFPVGIGVFDVATLGGGANPTGTITFTLFPPGNTTCTGAPAFTNTKPVTGNGNYTSDSFTTTQAGTYQWVASYSGDANNTPTATTCGDVAEQVIVVKKTPTLATAASAPSGGQISDTATLSGGAGPSGPTGTITFTLFGPGNLTCAGAPIFTNTKPVAGNGIYPSDPFTPAQSGVYQWVAIYSGDANNNAAGTLCSDPAEAVTVTVAGNVTPVLTTQASPGVAVGGQVTDTATLAGGNAPTGTITFSLYGPNDPTCVNAAAFTSTKMVAGNGGYTSDPFTTTQAGTFRWRAVYSGSAGNNGVSTACADPNEQVVVTAVGPVTPTLTTQASPAVSLGGSITDSATLAGGNAPTGTITFTLFGPNDPTCVTTPAFAGTKTVTGNGVYVSNAFTPVSAGTYRWRAAYGGDANNNAVSTACNDPNESVVVSALATPTLVTTASANVALGGQVTDTATLSGGTTPTGSITFTLYGPNDATCSTAAVFTNAKVVAAGNGAYASDPFTPTLAGTYRWRAAYSGDVNNNPISTACNDPNEAVTVTGGGGPVTPTLTTQASGTVALGGQVTDTATLAGGSAPSGSITFTLFGPNDATCSTAAVFTNTKTVSGNGAIASDPFTPTAAGTYRWRAAYSGDAGNNAVSTACADPNESVVVTAGASITVAKSAAPASLPEPGGTFTFTVLVTNTGPMNVTVATITDSVYGNVVGKGTCAAGAVLAPAGTYTCSFPGAFTGNAGASQTDTVTVTATPAAGPAASASAMATVGLTNVLPNVTVQKTAAPGSRPAPGGSFTFTVVVGNAGTEAVTITALTDDKYGNIAQQGTCTTAVGTILQPAGSYTCQFTGTFTGAAGASQTDTVTATARDDENTTGSASDSATVSISGPEPPRITVQKAANPVTLAPPGGPVTYAVRVTNDGATNVVITALTDDKFGDLTRLGTCTTATTTNLAPGVSYGCTFTGTVSGAAGATHTNVVTATVRDTNGATTTGSDHATVAVTGSAPAIVVDLSTPQTTFPEPGSPLFTYTLTMTNASTVPLKVTGFTPAGLTTIGCATGATIAANGGTFSCTFPAGFTGNAGASRTDTVTVTAAPVAGGPSVSGSDSVTLTIADIPPKVELVNSVNPGSRPEEGGTFTHTVTVTNLQPEPARITALMDSLYGNLNTRAGSTCNGAVGTVLAAATPGSATPAAGSAYTCTFSAEVVGNGGTSVTDTAQVTVTDDEGTAVTASDAATVQLVDVPPKVKVDLTVSPRTLLAPGGSVVYTVVVSNLSNPEAVTITALRTDVHGSLDGRGTCRLGQVLPAPLAGSTSAYTCSFTATFTGNPGDTLVTVATVVVADNEGTTATATSPAEPATVTIASVGAGGSGGGTGGGGAGGQAVARTGADVTGAIRFAGVLVLVGVALAAGARSRKLRWPL